MLQPALGKIDRLTKSFTVNLFLIQLIFCDFKTFLFNNKHELPLLSQLSMESNFIK